LRHGGGSGDLALQVTGGNVGIGKTSPNYKLDVDGTINASGLLLTNGTFSIGEGGRIGIGTSEPTEALVVLGNASFNKSDGTGSVFIDTTNDVIRFIGENGSLYQPVYGTDDDLVLYLPFSRGGNSSASVATSNVTVHDRSPFGNDGQCYGTDLTDGCNWTTGKYGNALFFGGTGTYVDTSDEISFAESVSFSVSAWIKTTTVATGTAYIVDRTTGTNDLINLYRSNDDIVFRLRGDDGLGITTLTGADQLTADTWYHVVGVRDVGSDLMILYLNGVEINSTTDDTSGTNSPVIRIGDHSDGALGWNGSIDEVRIYKRALAPEEIRTHYLRGSGFGASGTITADKFRIVNTSGNVNFIVDNNGNVGIGTTSPSVALQVVGDINATNAITADGDSGTNRVELTTDGNIEITRSATPFIDFKDNLETDRDFRIQMLGNDSLGFLGADLVTRLFINGTTGNVGIGTRSPADDLEVRGVIRVSDGTDTLRISTSGAALDIITNNALHINTNINQDIYMVAGTSTGQVGIGTITPATTLDVQGKLNVTGNTSIGFDTLFVDNTSGRVGIGTTSPTQKLHVSGSGTEVRQYISSTAAASTSNVGSLGFRADTSTQQRTTAELVGSFDDTTDASRTGRLNFDLPDSGTFLTRMSIVGGNVGINTTTPAQTLTVQGTLNVTADTTAGPNLFVASDGNVGIGKTSPNYKLDVDGTINASGLLLTNGTFSIGEGGRIGIGTADPDEALVVLGNASFNRSDGTGSVFIDTTNDAILFTGENGSLYQPVYGTDDDLVLYLPFNGPNGTTQYDRSPYGNDGTLKGGIVCNASYGKYGNGCYLDNNTEDYIEAQSTGYSLEAAFTISYWIKLRNNPNAESGVGQRGFNKWVYIDSSGNPCLGVRSSGDPQVDFCYSVPLTLGRWYHIGGTFEQRGDDMFGWIYVDGALVATNNVTNTPFNTEGNEIRIGTAIHVINNFLNASIDEVRIYKRALAPEEIRTHYLRGSGFGASGAITADKFRIVNTSGSKQLVLNQTAFSILNSSGGDGLFVVDDWDC